MHLAYATSVASTAPALLRLNSAAIAVACERSVDFARTVRTASVRAPGVGLLVARLMPTPDHAMRVDIGLVFRQPGGDDRDPEAHRLVHAAIPQKDLCNSIGT